MSYIKVKKKVEEESDWRGTPLAAKIGTRARAAGRTRLLLGGLVPRGCLTAQRDEGTIYPRKNRRQGQEETKRQTKKIQKGENASGGKGNSVQGKGKGLTRPYSNQKEGE